MKMKAYSPNGVLKATFSIVAADPSAKQVGVAVQSKYFAVGAVVPWVRSGVGAVATQARGLARYGPVLLDSLAEGKNPQAALDEALALDQLASERQIGVVSAEGETANHTGKDCLEWAGSRSGPRYSVQGNILVGEEVVEAMAKAFLNAEGTLAERLLVSLEAGQQAGGDKRGQQSAALLVKQLGYEDIGAEGIDRLVDLRVDDHIEPIKELRRLFVLWQINEMNEQAMLRYLGGDYSSASAILVQANSQFPDNPNILYNLACFECLLGQTDESLFHLKQALRLEPSFKEMAKSDPDFEAINGTSTFIDLTSS